MSGVKTQGAGLAFKLTTALAIIALVLVTVNGVLIFRNQKLQRTISSRQQFINQSAVLSRVNHQLVNELARVAVKKKDKALRELLADSGIKIHINGGKSGPGAPAK